MNYIIRSSTGEDDTEDEESWKACLKVIEKLRRRLPDVFAAESGVVETFALVHDDLSWNNILLNQNSELAAIVYWECVPVLHLWKVCQIPLFLRSRHWASKPQEDESPLDTGEKQREHTWRIWRSMRRHDCVKSSLITLRKKHLNGLRCMRIRCRKSNQNFHLATYNCENPMALKNIDEWLASFHDTVAQSSLAHLLLHYHSIN